MCVAYNGCLNVDNIPKVDYNNKQIVPRDDNN